MADQNNPEQTQEVAIIFAIPVKVPINLELADDAIQKIINEVDSPLKPTFKVPDSEIQPTGCFDIVWLEDADTNAGKCIHCGEWTSDLSLPECVRGIHDGKRDRVTYHCRICQTLEDFPIEIDDHHES